MDEMTLHRKRRLRELIAGPPYAGSQKAFGAAVGLTEGRVSQLLDVAQSFGERSARKIAAELRLDERYFESGFTEPESEFVQVRRADVQFSNGAGKIVYFEDDRPPLSFRADFLRKIGIATGNALIVDAAGDSNWPKIHDGMVILVDRGKTTPNGEFFAFRYHDELLIKRLTKLDKVGILATAENSDFRPREKVYTADEMDRFEILGQCVWGAGLL